MKEFTEMGSAELVRKLILLEKECVPITSMTYFGSHLTIGRIDFLQDPLPLEETGFVLAMSDKRRREFIAGRTAARLSMIRSGHQPSAVLRGAGGAPIWPDGLSGSLTHNDRLAAAVIVAGNLPASIGIDIEENVPLPDDLLDLVLTSVEREKWSSHHRGRTNVYAKILFSAKEAVFKADWPRNGEFLDFADIEMSQVSEDVLIGTVTSTSKRRDYLVSVACSAQTIVTLSWTNPYDKNRLLQVGN